MRNIIKIKAANQRGQTKQPLALHGVFITSGCPGNRGVNHHVSTHRDSRQRHRELVRDGADLRSLLVNLLEKCKEILLSNINITKYYYLKCKEISPHIIRKQI